MSGAYRPWTPDDQSKAEVAAACGVSFRAIGRMLGRSDSTVRCHLLPAEAEAHRERTCQNHRRRSAEEPLKTTWRNMLRRCENPKSADWPIYGGRGIKVCPEWHDFERFKSDLPPKPSPGHSIDRIENEGHYEPDNVRWATRVEQMRNRRNNRMVGRDGVVMTLAEACELGGVDRRLGWDRIAAGYPVEFATDESQFQAMDPASRRRFLAWLRARDVPLR